MASDTEPSNSEDVSQTDKDMSNKSEKKYYYTYKQFKDWQLVTDTSTTSEEDIMAFLKDVRAEKKYAPPTMWAVYSMLKKTLLTKDKIDISSYVSINAYLKKLSVGYTSIHAKNFTEKQLDCFISDAPDDTYLAMKVACILGWKGGLRRVEITDLSVDCVEQLSSDRGTQLLKFNIPKTKTHHSKSFIVEGKYKQIVEKYRDLRPKITSSKRFFLNYQNGKCFNKNIGINTIGKMPSQIAEYLKLEDPGRYTGHSWREIITNSTDSGAEKTTIKRSEKVKSNKITGRSTRESRSQNSEKNRKQSEDETSMDMDDFPESTSSGTLEMNEKILELDMDTLPTSEAIFIKEEFDEDPLSPSDSPQPVNPLTSYQDQSVQADFKHDSVNFNVFMCNAYNKNRHTSDAETQVNTPNPTPPLIPIPILEERKKSIRGKCTTGFHGFESLKTDEESLEFAGVDLESFKILLSLLQGSISFSRISKENRLLLFLCKLRLGVSFSALGVMFNVLPRTASKIFYILLEQLTWSCKNFVSWPTKKQIAELLPEGFAEYCDDCRVIVEFLNIEVNDVDSRKTRSKEEGRSIKFLVGFAPHGVVSFLSKGQDGRLNESDITNISGLMKLLKGNDVILADREFPRIQVNKDGAVFDGEVEEGDEERNNEAKRMGQLRIHIRNVLERIKIYRILDKMTNQMAEHANDIVFMCCVLVNLQPLNMKYNNVA